MISQKIYKKLGTMSSNFFCNKNQEGDETLPEAKKAGSS
jgi:hypothetical protein